MRPFIYSIITILIFTACNKAILQSKETELRISNGSTSSFDSVIVKSPGGKQVYYNIAAGSSSGYRIFSFLYNYAYMEVHFNNQLLKLQPFDYVGEEKLNAGRYTYKIGIVPGSQPYLSLECKKD